jgi:nitrate reductase cytochrome c-type subunit
MKHPPPTPPLPHRKRPEGRPRTPPEKIHPNPSFGKGGAFRIPSSPLSQRWALFGKTGGVSSTATPGSHPGLPNCTLKGAGQRRIPSSVLSQRWALSGKTVGGVLLLLLLLLLLPAVACAPADPGEGTAVAVPNRPGATKTAALQRAERRLYDGAPPVIPHEEQSATCTSCHNQEGMSVPGLGFAPPSPHSETAGLGEVRYCRQCHLFQRVADPGDVFVANTFVGLSQDLRHGRRLNALAPPVIPHRVFMRENCVACHSGPAAREEIRTPHPERMNCRQCHVEQVTSDTFQGGL